MIDIVRRALTSSLDKVLVDELLNAHAEAKRNFYLGGLRLSGVEGGRFCEAAFRILQQRTTGTFDQLGTQLGTDTLVRQLANIPAGAQPESVRLHIPRALRVIYDIRNKRDIAHLGDGIDPNLQDATLVTTIADWVLAEFVRLYQGMSAEEAQSVVDSIVTRAAPAIEDFGGFLKSLRPDLRASDLVLLLLYQCGTKGAPLKDLEAWVHPKMVSNLRRTLRTAQHDRAQVHCDNDRFFITRLGQQEVERRHLMDA